MDQSTDENLSAEGTMKPADLLAALDADQTIRGGAAEHAVVLASSEDIGSVRRLVQRRRAACVCP